MTTTFLRFQEHFESPKFRCDILEPFYDERFKRLTRRERALLDFFCGQQGRFYIIGTPQGAGPETLKPGLPRVGLA